MKWGRRWLDDVVSGRATTVAQLGVREKYSVSQVNPSISLAFPAPSLVKAAVEDRLRRGVGIEPQENQQMSKHRVLGFNPQLRLEWRGQYGQ